MRRLHLITLLFMSGILTACGLVAPKFMKETPTSYEYTYNGTFAYPIEWILVEQDGSGNICLKHSKAGNEITVYKAPEDVFQRIGALASEYRLYRLKDFYKPVGTIFDGNSWTLRIRYRDGSIYSSGYHTWPSRQLMAGINALNDYLNGIIESAPESDVIGHELHR